MKTYSERTSDILNKRNAEKARRKKVRRTAVFSALGAGMVAFACVLFVPFSTTPPSVAQYKNSEYYTVIKQLNAAAYEPPEYKNNFEKWSNGVAEFFASIGNVCKDMAGGANGAVDEDFADGDDLAALPSPENGNGYVETTDNQVAGVTEGDLLKRSGTHLFYAAPSSDQILVRAYSIAGKDSEQVGEYIVRNDGYTVFFSNMEMYLSEDCTRLTLVCPTRVYPKEYKVAGDRLQTAVISLDVSDPKNMESVGNTTVCGSYVSSRVVGGKLLLVNNYALQKYTMNFEDESTFLPQYSEDGRDSYVSSEDIVCPERADQTKYTLIFELDEKTLQVDDCKALLSYSSDIYVSRENLFAAHGYTASEKSRSKTVSTAKTEIAQIGYTGEGLEVKGSFTVDGTIKDQYSMDEFNGVLRLVTSTRKTTTARGRETSSNTAERNVNLYCVSLTDYAVLGSELAFAPEGEEARSVRFDGNKAYVCTAIVITFKDPVYAFDLSDAENITYVETGTIDGYSTSLVNFKDGYLLGIGYGSVMVPLKIEIYEETETSVRSVCKFEGLYEFSEEYKSYFIDRERGLIGLEVYDFANDVYADGYSRYILLQFDGSELVEILNVALESKPDFARATLIDGCFYMFGTAYSNDAVFAVEQIFDADALPGE